MTAVQEPAQAADPREALAAEFRAAVPDPTDAVAVERFYANSQHLAADLDAWHVDDAARRQWTDIIVETARINNVRSVLDVGCGVGHDLKALADSGVAFAAGVEPNASLRNSLANALLPARSETFFATIQPSLTDLVFVRPFDLTLCIDVLEHLPDPTAFLHQMAAHIPVGGLLFEATATTDVETPLHLRSNWGWSPVATLYGLGFKLEGQWDRLRLWSRRSLSLAPMPALLMAVWRGMENRTLQCVMNTLRPREFAPRGYAFMLSDNDALISRARGRVVADWYRTCNSDVFLMVDGDMVFNPEDADRLVRLCRDGHDIIGAGYAVRSGTHLSSRPLGESTVVFAADSEPVEAEYVATGFMAVHRRVLDALVKVTPISHPHMDWAYWTVFTPFVKDNEELSEDWAFCERARQLGFKVWLDPAIRLGHIGTKVWTVEDIGRGEGAEQQPAVVRLTTRPEPAALKDEA